MECSLQVQINQAHWIGGEVNRLNSSGMVWGDLKMSVLTGRNVLSPTFARHLQAGGSAQDPQITFSKEPHLRPAPGALHPAVK